MRLSRVTCLFFSLYLLVGSAYAYAIERPEILLEEVTQEMLVALKRNDSQIKKDPQRLVQIIEDILVPHVDIYDMSRWVVGRNAWLKASNSQKQRFAKEFKNLMIRTYASSLTAYSDQTIVYKPVRGDVSNKKRVQVSSQILESGRAPINVTYRLVQKQDKWRVYDIIIEGVSLLKGFKSQFAQDIQQSGLDTVIDKMSSHNQKPIL